MTRIKPMGNLKAILIEKGISQKQLGVMVGIPEPTVSQIIRGRFNPTEETLKKIAKALKVNVKRIL